MGTAVYDQFPRETAVKTAAQPRSRPALTEEESGQVGFAAMAGNLFTWLRETIQGWKKE